jgi:hypothetical protein
MTTVALKAKLTVGTGLVLFALSILLLAFGGCHRQAEPAFLYTLSPVGDAVCIEAGNGWDLTVVNIVDLDDMLVQAISYWDLAGLRLVPKCDSNAARMWMAPDIADGLVGIETLVPGEPPRIFLSPAVLGWAAMGDTRGGAQVVAHELGHAMGLHHANDSASVMYPWFHPLPDEPPPADIGLARELMIHNGEE